MKTEDEMLVTLKVRVVELMRGCSLASDVVAFL